MWYFLYRNLLVIVGYVNENFICGYSSEYD